MRYTDTHTRETVTQSLKKKYKGRKKVAGSGGTTGKVVLWPPSAHT